jgi:hypothetical protein
MELMRVEQDEFCEDWVTLSDHHKGLRLPWEVRMHLPGGRQVQPGLRPGATKQKAPTI